MTRKNTKFGSFYLVIVFLVLYAPILFLMAYSFNSGETMNHFEGVTLDHYSALFSDSRILGIMIDTVILAIISATIATIIGTLGALVIYYLKNERTRRVALNLNNVLLVSPDVIIGASLLILFTMVGFQLGFFSVLLSHIAFNIPIVVLMVLPQLTEMNQSLIVAARDLGANSRQILSRIILPIITPGILSGFFMAFTYSLDDFAVTFFVTGNGFSTLSVEIFSRARRGVSLEINALSTLIFFVSLALVLGNFFLQKKRHHKANRMIVGGSLQ